MKTLLTLIISILIFNVTIAQSTADKAAAGTGKVNKDVGTVNVAADNIYGAANGVNNTASTLKSTAGTIKELPGIFGFKKKPKATKAENSPVANTSAEVANNTVSTGSNSSNTTSDALSNTTIVNITGADYEKLSNIKERIKTMASVSDAKMKFDVSSPSVITVLHKGSTEDLFTVMKEACKDLFKSSNLTGMDEGRINLKL